MSMTKNDRLQIRVGPAEKRLLEQAKAAAGDKDVGVWGGANVFRQYLAAGLLDEVQIHLIPVLLGDGVRLSSRQATDASSWSDSVWAQSGLLTDLRFRVRDYGLGK